MIKSFMKKGESMPVTINDVAKEAGVSISTVSRVLNNNYPVKEETRIRIEKAIEKLNYKPNIAARSLITRKTSVIGIIVPGITNLFFPTLVEIIEGFLTGSGYSISLCNTGGEALKEVELINQMMSRQVDGLILIDPTLENLDNGYFDEISRSLPMILVNGFPGNYQCNFVSYDEEIGAREAFMYLLELGHRNIAFIRGNKSLSYDIKEKVYKNIVKSNGLNYEKVLHVGKGNSMDVVERTREQIEELLTGNERPTAFFACNDLMAVGVVNACNRMGISIPDEISVIGFDNTLLSGITHPKLSSVDLNIKKIGRRAALELINIIDSRNKSRIKYFLETSLIVRDSCGKANSANS